MFNTVLKDQLKSAIKNKKIRLKHFDGEELWRKKFDHFYKLTGGNLDRTLDIMYGPDGGVNNYKGSIYRNSRIRVNEQFKKAQKSIERTRIVKDSKIFNFIKNKKGDDHK